MKRFWIGICVLALLLIGGIVVSALFCIAHEPTAQLLQDASKAALEGDWKQANRLCHQAEDRWEDFWQFTASFADHSPMDEIDSLFAQLEILGAQRNAEQFPALCARLSELTEAIADSHRFRWWTLL